MCGLSGYAVWNAQGYNQQWLQWALRASLITLWLCVDACTVSGSGSPSEALGLSVRLCKAVGVGLESVTRGIRKQYVLQSAKLS